MNGTPPDNAITAMILLTAIAVAIVLLTETLSNWLR